MRPTFFLASAVLLILLGNASIGAGGGDQVRAGREIYNEGLGRDLITVRLGEGRWRPARGTLTCRTCHGETGEGASEGGIVAPRLAPPGGDQSVVTRWLDEAMIRHRGRYGEKLGDAMPLYRITERDLAALSAYIARLPDVPIRGLTPKAVQIGLDVANAPLTPNGRIHLREAADMLASSVNAEGGVYGRAIEFDVRDGAQTEAMESLIWIGWTATADVRPLSLVIQSDGEKEASCGSVDPTLEQMTLAVTEMLGTGRAPQNVGEVPNPKNRMMGDALILSRSDGWIDQALAAERVFLSPELAAELRPRNPQAQIHVVAPGDISMRAAAAQNLLDRGLDNPRDAMVVAVYREAIDVVLESLRTNGRRVTPYAICDAAKRLASARQKVSIIDGKDVRILAAFSNNSP